MFAQFRAQYPQGSIKTEMLPKVDGLHVFRVTVEHSGIVLSTATAADTDIETTEDRAVKRALIMAGVSFNDNYGMKATLMPQQSAKNLSSSLMSRKNAEALPAVTQAAVHFEEQLDLVELGSNNYQSHNYESEHSYYEEPEYEPSESPPVPKSSTKSVVPGVPVPSPIAAPTEPTISSVSPVDLSDPIAQIDVEMERLAWDRNMGRGYLQKTFNKRSRQQLSDSELIQFLTHLKSLPTPTQI
jgi:hypothetical protein